MNTENRKDTINRLKQISEDIRSGILVITDKLLDKLADIGVNLTGYKGYTSKNKTHQKVNSLPNKV